MMDELLETLRDCLEGRRSYASWTEWWEVNAGRVEAECGRYVYLRLEKRGLGVGHVILEEHGMVVEWRAGYCRRCGEKTLMARPGVTTQGEIREFAERAKMKGWEEIVESGWIHPGEHCATHGVLALWEYADRLPEVEGASVRGGWRPRFRLVAWADRREALEAWRAWGQYYEPGDIDVLAELGYDREVVRGAIEATGWSDDYWFPIPSGTPVGTFQFEVRRMTFKTPDDLEIEGWVNDSGHAVVLLGKSEEWGINAGLMDLYEEEKGRMLEDLGLAAGTVLFPLRYWMEELGGERVFPGEVVGWGSGE